MCGHKYQAASRRHPKCKWVFKVWTIQAKGTVYRLILFYIPYGIFLWFYFLKFCDKCIIFVSEGNVFLG